jgi:transcriptional regulator with XRE-family HTH domain
MVIDDTTREVARRVATWLKHAYPLNAGKEAARAFKVSPHTVKKWMQGELPPRNRKLMAMIKLWGRPFVNYVFAPLLPSAKDLADELVEIKRRVAQLEPHIRDDLHLAVDPKIYFQARSQDEMARLARETPQENRQGSVNPEPGSAVV